MDSPTQAAERLSEAVKAGDYKTQLEALRDVLTELLPTAAHREAAALANQLRTVLKELHDIPEAVNSDAPDAALKKRRSSRLKAV